MYSHFLFGEDLRLVWGSRHLTLIRSKHQLPTLSVYYFACCNKLLFIDGWEYGIMLNNMTIPQWTCWQNQTLVVLCASRILQAGNSRPETDGQLSLVPRTNCSAVFRICCSALRKYSRSSYKCEQRATKSNTERLICPDVEIPSRLISVIFFTFHNKHSGRLLTSPCVQLSPAHSFIFSVATVLLICCAATCWSVN